MHVNKREIEQFFFITRISARLRFMSFPHERTRDNFFFLRENIRETADCVISA
jgi:hypothetical protein